MEYEFKTWEQSLFEAYPDNIPAQIEAHKRPDIDAFIKHHVAEAGRAAGAERPLYDVNKFIGEIKRVLDCVDPESDPLKDFALTAKAFYDLGRHAEALKHPSSEARLEDAKKMLALTQAQTQARIEALEQKMKLSLGGQSGGLKAKRRAWADAIARELAAGGYNTQAEAWNSIPNQDDHEPPLEIETNEADFEVYREGNPADENEQIIGLNTETGEEQALRKKTFMRNYYRKAKNSE